MAFIQGGNPLERQKALEMQALAQSLGQGVEAGISSYQKAQDRQLALDAQKRQLEQQAQAQNIQDLQTYQALSDKYSGVTPETIKNVRTQGLGALGEVKQKQFEQTYEGQKYQAQKALEDQRKLEEENRAFERQKILEGIKSQNALELAKQKGEISGQSKGLGEKAYKEEVKLREYDNTAKNVSGVYDQLSKIPTLQANLPGIAGGKRESFKALQAQLAATITGKFPGIRSDSDFRNIVAPMIPTGFETTQQEIDDKKAAFNNWLNANRPVSPVLEKKGLTQYQQNQAQDLTDPEFLAWKKSKGL